MKSNETVVVKKLLARLGKKKRHANRDRSREKEHWWVRSVLKRARRYIHGDNANAVERQRKANMRV